MKDHAIIFSAPMVEAILAGKKTQTRRLVQPTPGTAQTPSDIDEATFAETRLFDPGSHLPARWANRWCARLWSGPGRTVWVGCPHQPGQTLWVRETFMRLEIACWPDLPHRRAPAGEDGPPVAFYRAGFDRSGRMHWRPAIHMPRWASRIQLEVTSVHVERVQALTEEDALAEGVSDVKAFASLWDRIHRTKQTTWDRNPWVWRYAFKRTDLEAREP